MVKRRLTEHQTQTLTLWLNQELEERYKEIFRRAEKRSPYAGPADVIRRLLLLDTNEDLLTDEDLKYFRGQSEAASSTRVRRGGAQGSPRKTTKRRVNGKDEED